MKPQLPTKTGGSPPANTAKQQPSGDSSRRATLKETPPGSKQASQQPQLQSQAGNGGPSPGPATTTTASDTHWSQSWQPAEWQYDGGGTHPAGAATQPHAAHHRQQQRSPPYRHLAAAQGQSNAGAHHPQPSWNTTETQPSSSSSHQPARGSQRPLNTDPLWDGRTLRLSARPRGDNSPGPPPWSTRSEMDPVRTAGGPHSTTGPAPSPHPPNSRSTPTSCSAIAALRQPNKHFRQPTAGGDPGHASSSKFSSSTI